MGQTYADFSVFKIPQIRRFPGLPASVLIRHLAGSPGEPSSRELPLSRPDPVAPGCIHEARASSVNDDLVQPESVRRFSHAPLGKCKQFGCIISLFSYILRKGKQLYCPYTNDNIVISVAEREGDKEEDENNCIYF